MSVRPHARADGFAPWHGVRGAMAGLAARAAAGDAAAAGLLASTAAWRAAFAAAPGQRWANYIESPDAFAAAVFGAWHAGKHVVLPGDLRADTVEALRAHVDGWAGDIDGALVPGVPDLPDLPYLRAPSGATAGDAAPNGWPTLPADTPVTLFTSGSTGAPTAIEKRLSQLDAETATLQAAFGAFTGARIGVDTQVLTTVSHQHIYGLLFCVLWPLAAGRALADGRLAFNEELVTRCAAMAQDTAVLVTSPAHLRRLPEGLDWTPVRGRLAAVFSSGGPLPPSAADDALRQLGQSPIEVFGSSETGGIASRQRATHGDRWTALPGVEWRIEDRFLAVRSPHLPGDGWYVCPDLAYADTDRSFVLQGRADRIEKIEEKRVSLTAIEQALMASPWVRDARVLLMELPVGTRIAAALALTDEGDAALAERGRAALIAGLKASLAGSIDPLAVPRRWHASRDDLPANTQGKTTDAALRDLFRQTLPSVTWLARDSAKAAAMLDVHPHLAVFDGHFPGAPIVPGVAQVDWVMTLAPQALPVPPRDAFLRLDVLKFQGIIRPGMQVRMDLEWLADKRALAFRLTSDAGPHASGRVAFGSGHD
ncbi:AMP-binding protein [Cupriavidus plantarum]|uniref:AMP-binding protein n=1 Tax=Cupriavidus plantarum TaxID=942865 RepID=UPI00339D902D